MENLVLVGGIALGVIVLIASLWAFISHNYIKIGPNTAAVIYGRKNQSAETGTDGVVMTKGYRLITGGGVFKIPFFEDVEFMDLSNRMLNIVVEDAPNKDGVMTTIEGNANVKFANDKGLLEKAVERFLGKSNQEIDKNIHENLSGHLRAVIGKMTIEQLINDKTALNQSVLEEANDDFMKMGIRIDFVNITEVSDKDNYIENLGKRRAAEIQRDAEVGTAKAKRDSVKETSIAEREGVEIANQNQIKIAESDRNRDINKADMKAEVDTRNESANQAGPLSQAKAMKAVVEAQANTEAAAEKAQSLVEEQRALKAEKTYLADKIVPAEADKRARIIMANASKESTVIESEGQRDSDIIKAKGIADSIVLKQKAEAEGIAVNIEQKGVAEAAAIKAKGLAEAEALEAKMLAEAKGILEKATAYEKLDETGKFLEILNALQTLVPNSIEKFAQVMAASTAHLANVDDIKIIDFGGNGNSDGSVSKFGQAPMEILNKFFAGMGATGFDTNKLASFIGVKTPSDEDESNTKINKQPESKTPLNKDDKDFPAVS